MRSLCACCPEEQEHFKSIHITCSPNTSQVLHLMSEAEGICPSTAPSVSVVNVFITIQYYLYTHNHRDSAS